MTDEQQALKPCPVPWCREAEQISFIVSHWSGNACVECLTCKARGPWEASKEAAIAAWNNRTSESLVSAYSILNEIRDNLSADYLDRVFGPDMKFHIDTVLRSQATP